MSPDDFEKRLQRQPFREVPGEWRESILRGAVASVTSSHEPRSSFFSTLNAQLSTALWLRPRAWAGLGVVWILIFALHFASRDSAPQMAKNSRASAPEMATTLKEQQQVLAELMGAKEPSEMDKPKRPSAQPHTERRGATSMA